MFAYWGLRAYQPHRSFCAHTRRALGAQFLNFTIVASVHVHNFRFLYNALKLRLPIQMQQQLLQDYLPQSHILGHFFPSTLQRITISFPKKTCVRDDSSRCGKPSHSLYRCQQGQKPLDDTAYVIFTDKGKSHALSLQKPINLTLRLQQKECEA